MGSSEPPNSTGRSLKVQRSPAFSSILLCVVLGEVAQHVRVNVQADAGYVVDVLRGH